MSVSVLRFDAAGLKVEIRTALREVHTALEAMWRPALTESSPELLYEVDAEGRVLSNGIRLGKDQDRGRIAALIEGDLLQALALRARSSLVLHAGAVVFGEQLLLFVGEANSGKSTMTRAALRHGATYITDDSLLFDGASCRGLARSVHFDSLLLSELECRPSYLSDCDLESYRFQGSDGRIWATPIWQGSFETLRDFAPRHGKTVVVTIERSQIPSIRELTALERAAVLVGASLAGATPNWSVVPRGPSFRLAWNRDPEGSLAELLKLLKARA